MAQQYSYKPNMNRNVTRKWAEARKVNYDAGWGDDGDEDDEPSPPRSQGARSFTNPPALSTQRLSFDRGLGNEQRVFSASVAQPPQGFPQLPPSQRQYAQPPHESTGSTGRPSIDASSRPDSRSSNPQFPPRKQSLGQNEAPAFSRAAPEEPPSKPLPFIRPADIYRRHAEEEELRRSQESSRPSIDSLPKEGSLDEPVRKRQPTLDTVAERKSEHLDSLVAAPAATDQPAVQKIDTNVPSAQSIPSASSRYTDRPDPVSASSGFPSRNVSLTEPPSTTTTRHQLPAISRASTFGSEMFQSEGLHHDQQPAVPEKDAREIQHKPSMGYRSMVKDAFQSENHRGRAHSDADESLGRSNTTSTSDISPIVTRQKELDWERGLADIQEKAEPGEFTPPRRINTNRRDSPSPARRPLSMEAPPLPEPQSAVTVPESHAAQDTVRDASITRPDPAILLQSGHPSGESVPEADVRKQESGVSDESNQRTASEEWDQWTAAKREAHARHGIQDSNPTTPVIEPSAKSTPTQPEPLDKNMPEGKPRGIAALPSQQRPQVLRDDRFRPNLPGGWQSSTSIQKSTPELAPPRPGFASPSVRTDSNESVPTAKPPQSGWRSEYTTGPQAQAFAAASAAGAALAGAFNGPAFASAGGSEVSSIDERHEGPTGLNRDPSLVHRDFGESAPESAAIPEESATKAFAEETTPKAPQGQFSKPAPIRTGHPELKTTVTDSVKTDSPTKDSEHWWSDNDEEPAPAPAPAPLRTARLSMMDPRPTISPLRTDSDDADADKLHSDIVKSLTPKSSNLENAEERPSPSKTRSPPFAAAALAVSPGREIQAMQEHNGWKPLQAPQPKTQSPVAENLSIVGQTKDEPVSASPVTSASAQDRATSPDKAPEDLPLKTRSLSKEFAVFADVPALAPFEMGSTSTAEPVKELEGEQYSAKETAHEAATVDRQSTPEQASVKDLPVPATPSKDLPQPISTREDTSRPTTPKVSVPVSPITPQVTKPQYESARPFPTAKIPTEKIVSMSSAQQRIQAYKDNREVYAQSVGQLEDWLSFMNTSEHVDVFTANPISTTPYVPSPKHSRQDSATPSGRQQFREDGQKLVAAASKYGAKASVLGKGLFSRGKEKFRNVSSGQKGLDRNKNVSTPEVNKSSNSAPQIPTPNIISPIDESSISTYFSNRDGAHPAVEPPFSPISEISSEPQMSHQHVGEQQSPQSGSTLRPIDATPTRADTKNSAGGISAIETDEGRKSADILSPAHDVQRGLSVSDVSSITEPDRTPDMVERGQTIDTAAKTISPADDQQRSHHAPSYSTAMASAPVPTKEAEASEDRQEDSTLPAYQAPKPPRIAPGAQIVAIARIKPDEEPPQPGPSRPFSFAGSESILGHGTNQSLNSAMSAAQPDPVSAQAQGVSPLPSARRNPEELARKVQTAEEFARLRAQSQSNSAQPDPEEEFRIPGPYGQELRSLKPKTSSPILQQMLGSSTATQSEGDTFDIPAAPSGDTFAAVGAARSQQQPGPGQYAQQTPQEAFDAMLNTPPQPMPQQTQSQESERDQPRGRSKISSLFGRSRSKSRSRRLQKDEPQRHLPEASGRPDSGRRNSLFRLGGRGTSTPTPGEEYDEITDYTTQTSARPTTSSRKLSKDLFKNTTVGAGGYTQHQQVPAKEKKKRFSGLFSKSAKDVGPQRASTLPLNAQGPNLSFHRQATIPEQCQAQRNNFQRETMYAESVAQQQQQQHPALRQHSPQPANYQPPIQGFYGHAEDQSDPQQSYDSQQDQYSLYSHSSFRQPHPTGIYQHENRPYPYENDMSKTGAFPSPSSQQQPQYQQRPDLPRLDTGEQRTSSPFGPASAPSVPATYPANHQNTMTTFPSSTYDQPQSQQSFSAAATQYPQIYRPPSTRANKDISYGSDFFPPRTISSPVPAQRFGQSPAEASRITPRVAALHARSRSPKLGRRSSEDLEAAYDSLRGRSPTDQLGTFSSKKVSPIGGVPRSAEEQEKPWTINLPGEEPPEPNDPASATSPKAREMRRIMLERSPTAQTQPAQQEIRPQTVAEKFMGAPARPVQNVVGNSVGLRNSASAHQPMGDTEVQNLSATQQTSVPTTSMHKDNAMLSKENWQTQKHNAAVPPTLSVSAPPNPDTSLAPKTTDQVDVASALPAVSGVPTSHSTPSPLSTAPPKPVPDNARDEKPTEIHEMPGSRPEGYESDEEPVMSATAYPGQEWQPVFDRWDD